MLLKTGISGFFRRGFFPDRVRDARTFALKGRGAVTRRHAEEDALYWEQVFKKIKPAVIEEMGDVIDPSIPLGLDPQVLKARGLATPTMHDYAMNVKLKYPQSILLNRCGDFYDLIGIDAMVAVDVLGCNWKSPGGRVPLAGIPVRNLPDRVADLNANGFSVAVTEQVEGKPAGKSAGSLKQREVAFVSTPASPVYLESQTGRRTAMNLPPPPKLGVVYGKNGCALYALRQEVDTVTVEQGLTLDGLLCQINALGIAPPILFHQSFEDPQGKKMLATLLKRIEKEVFDTPAPLKAFFSGSDPLTAFINEVRVRDYKNQDVQIKVASVEKGDRPRPPYLSSVMQLGLSPHAIGSPSLLDAAVSLQAPATCRNWLRTLLLSPPPYKQQAQLHAAVSQILVCQQAMFKLEHGLQSDMIMRVLRTQGAVPLKFFKQLNNLLCSISEYCGSQPHRGFVEPVMDFCAWELNYKHMWDCDKLHSQLQAVIKEINSVVDLEFVGSDMRADGSDEEGSVELPGPKWGFDPVDCFKQRSFKGKQSLARFREASEDNIHMLQRDQMPEEFDQVDRAYGKYEAHILHLFNDLSRQWLGRNPKSAKGAPEIYFYSKEQVTAVKLPQHSQLKIICEQKVDTGRNNEQIANTVTTFDMENSRREYWAACDAAKYKHVHTQGWCLPELSPPGAQPQQSRLSSPQPSPSSPISNTGTPITSYQARAQAVSRPNSAAPLALMGLRPYYLGLTDAPVPNNVEMGHNVWLLTGANMAGKSTILRSIAAAALLGTCGLMVPASSARIPAFDAIMLRNSSGDSATEGKSSFKMETDDVGMVLQECTKHSLVLADELGKGTEVDSGTALASVLAEWMAERGCTTILATHLHDLVSELADLEAAGRVVLMRMGLRPRSSSSTSSTSTSGDAVNEELEPTWKLEPGVCKESLALEVARSSGLPESFCAAVGRKRAVLRARRARLEALERLNGAGNRAPGAMQGSSNTTDSSSSSSSRSSSRAINDSMLGSSSEEEEEEELQEEGVDVQSSVGSMTGHAGQATAVAMAVDPKAVSKEQFQAAEDILMQSACRVYEDTGILEPPMSVFHLTPSQEVPPLHAAGGETGHAVYLCHYPQGEVYCGQSKSLQRRLKDHRTRSSTAQHKGPGTSMSYIIVKAGMGKRIETTTITALERAGIPLTSKGDAKKRNF
ncbi:muts domain V-domain-containing protein [Dunaliella salina]|uniref:Muts domain V-domain-containing protein n=1 Tax=Dunaliella salina TaxID=3046 RepID=A0ABQ7H796_DUNSA|nr:muts domain V-domain-containing protein [Dunaliella salina]|eukprot:KAF5842720.1 muts domain V-domain-containing protein [Dunaliella salina]